YIADSGHCSRRKAEELIRSGKVSLNGEIAGPGVRAGNEDKIKIGNKIVKPIEDKIYIKLNKPIGYICTNKKFKNEKNIFDLINLKERLFVVGRLDKNSRGLVVLTNDGSWANKMMHPSFEHEKEYRVKIKNQKSDIKIDVENKLLKGVNIGEGDGVVRVKKIERIKDNIFKIILTQGKKRQIRRMFKVLDLDVVNLKRVRIGDIKLENREEGKFDYFNLKK
ncbi:pseudouridine synthase, partial [bacterium]|nr:pseudouridine synthase [bacterium]